MNRPWESSAALRQKNNSKSKKHETNEGRGTEQTVSILRPDTKTDISAQSNVAVTGEHKSGSGGRPGTGSGSGHLLGNNSEKGGHLKPDLKCLYMNARSIRNKLDILRATVIAYDPDIV